MAPNRAIPTIVTTTEADQESQGSSAVVLPDNDKFFSTTSSPSSLSVSSIPSIPELQPVNNHPSQKEHLRATTSPLQHCYYPHSSNIIHSKSEGVLHTGSPLSLHRPAINHRFSEPSSSSYSRLEIPPQGLSPQTHISFPNAGLSYSENATYHNTSLPNGDCMTIPSHRPMSRSVSLEYHHQPHRCGQGHQIYRSPSPLIYSHGNHSCSPSNHVIVLEVAQNSHSKTDFPPPTVPCNCIENQCPHCGSVRGFSMLHHQPATVHVPVVTYTTHEGQISMLTMSSSPSTRRTKRGPNASKERGANWKLNTNQLSSAVAFQREQFMNPDESDSESEHCSRTYDDQEPNEATVCAENENSHNKLANNGSMRPMESSDCKSENKKVTEQRPLSATIGAASDAVTTTSTKYNLHASADTLGNAECKNNIY